ncbi:Uncharacterized protein HZ326_27969 [Fusarium oxysporum f. sp. albedinis]|nr:Uncharacterized protein HZ326_27969 [Fusarium oxysporum f. sp. albedinis]
MKSTHSPSSMAPGSPQSCPNRTVVSIHRLPSASSSCVVLDCERAYVQLCLAVHEGYNASPLTAKTRNIW